MQSKSNCLTLSLIKMEIKRQVTPSLMKRWNEPESFRNRDSAAVPQIQDILNIPTMTKQKLPNYSLSRWPQVDHKVRSKKRRQYIPQFVYDYLEDDAQPLSYSVKRPLPSKTVPPKTPNKQRYFKEPQREPCQQDLQKYDFVYRKRKNYNDKVYKPYTIDISPRAKMTVYLNMPSHNPIQRREVRSRHEKGRNTSSVPCERLSVAEKLQDESIAVHAHASTFGEMLKRARSIVDKQFN